MSVVDRFIRDVEADLRRRLALLGDCGDRRAIEDGIALLSDYRLDGMNEARLEKLIATLLSGRSPVGLAVLKPQRIGELLGQRWAAYAAEAAVPTTH